MTLAARVFVLAAVLFLEKFLLNFFVDFDSTQTAVGLGGVLRDLQHFGLRFCVTLGIALLVFSYASDNPRLTQMNDSARGTPLRIRWLLIHAALLLPLPPLLYTLYGDHGPALPFALQASLCIAFVLASAFALFAVMAPWALWRDTAKALGTLWLYALVAAVAATCAILWIQMLWAPTAFVTFHLVHTLLSTFLIVQSDPAHLILSTDNFAVQVSDICSGLEGAGLMLAFCAAWLLYFRKEYIFPRALLLIPAGLVVIFALNVLRIAALVVIGDKGFPEVAAYGFHSQAGWIAFNLAACGLAFASRRSVWLTRKEHLPRELHRDNPTAAYLLPFLAMLASGMIARAASDGFELLYSLRLFVGGAVLFAYWRRFTSLDWRVSWWGPAAGVAVFALWIISQPWVMTPARMPDTLAALPDGYRILWISGRFLTGVLLVPVVEELAYRGFLLRRLASPDFESVSFTAVGSWALIISSVVFGLGHGAMSVPAIAAGLIYGGVLMRTGRMGDAVSAHATTNLLIALDVLLFGQWQLW